MSKQITITFQQERLWQALGIFLLAVIVLNQLLAVSISITPRIKLAKKSGNEVQQVAQAENTSKIDLDVLRTQVVPQEGVTLPITWGDLGKRMIADGVIDEEKFKSVFPEDFDTDTTAIFKGQYDQPIVMTQENSRFLLDMLWAFGLANKNDILENGEMTSEKYGGDASKFAATGGWTLAAGNPMEHYSRYSYITLNDQQQALVDKVSSGIYRPCCGNSTHFPDCNHGMAMLGLLELMAAEGASEQQMYEVALRVNSYWFPQTYVDLATYFKEQGTDWLDIEPAIVLSENYSSARGYQQTRQKIESLPKPVGGGGSCGA